MATKKTTTKKSVNTVKKTANMQGTRVVCPECGAEFDVLAPHEHTEKNVTVLGVDSGMGTIYLPVQKRGEALQQAGIDTSKYFSIQLPTGGEQMMKMGDDGKAVPVSADDPIVKAILGGGTVPNRNLFRRWIMSQVFHGLTCKDWRGRVVGFAEWLKRHGYCYQWEMFIKELHDQAKLSRNGDIENYRARNRWFDKALALDMASDYIGQLRKDAKSRPQHKCKGVPYVTVDHTHYFVSDIEKKLIAPLWGYIRCIEKAKTPQELANAVRVFWDSVPVQPWDYKQCAKWKDAYKGMGAYATMQNLLRFHGCTFPKGNDFYDRQLTYLQMLNKAAIQYADGGGWKLFGLMKQCLEENHIDIEAKMKQWAAAKEAKRA